MVDVDELRKNKNQRLANLLALSTQPTRASLFKDIQLKGLLKRARPEIRELYNILEVDFHPLSICKKISPILAQIGADPEMGKYVQPLQQVILTRLFQQLSQVYESVDLEFVLGLAQFPEPFQVVKSTIEKFIMNGCKKGDLGIRIDHAAGVLTFDSDVFSSAKALHAGAAAGSAEADAGAVQRLQSTPAEIVRSQLVRLAKTLYITCQYVDPTFSEDQRKARAAALQRAEVGATKEHTDTLARREIIEKKKQAAATAAAQKKKDEETKSRLKTQELEQAERRRIEEQNRERELKRLKQEQAKVQREEVVRELDAIKNARGKLDLSQYDIDELDTGRIRMLKIQALEKEKGELSERLRIVGKRNDHLERALRLEEIKHLPEDYEKQRQRDVEEYEKTTEQTLAETKAKHTEAVSLKQRLSRLVGQYEEFRDQVRKDRHAQFEKQRQTAERELQKKKEARVREFRERKIRERQEQEARERAEREEEERLAREADEKAAADEERRQRLIEEKARRDEERKRLDEQAAKQRQREAEAEAKLAAKRRGPERPAAAPVERTDSNERPRVPIAGKSAGGWREREAARLAASTSDVQVEQPPSAPSEDVPPPSGSTRAGYVPPHLRKAVAPTGSEPAREGWRSNSRGREENAGQRSSGPSSGSRNFNRGERTDSPANGVPSRDFGRSTSGREPAPEASQERLESGGSGRYRPGAFSKRVQQG